MSAIIAPCISDIAVEASPASGRSTNADRGRFLAEAVSGLAATRPEFSARTVATRAQAGTLLTVAAAAAAACILWPFALAQVLVGLMSASFLVGMSFRAWLAWSGRQKECRGAAASPFDLPIYTVLVPVRREAAMLPGLIRALKALDYPRDRLDLKLVAEEDDAETLAAARTLARHGQFEIVAVPPCEPRTKPKACDYALHFARGEFVVVYDAEDRPEPDQLRKAVAAFRARRDTACFQARLAIYNQRDGWLARMFALDYAIWFRTLLPGLERIGAPMPLGGTSNHFRAGVLRAAGAWDPFNVTEDADLGIRLARLGHRVAMLDSTTFEEAPARLGPWLRQRTRWQKGYMQTLLVHTRRPATLARDVGLRGLAAIELFLGGAVWSALVNPVLWVIFAASCAFAQHGVHAHLMESLARITGLGLLAANALLAALSANGARATGRLSAAARALSYILYWILISAAAYRALPQLVLRPFHWEKTPHGADG